MPKSSHTSTLDFSKIVFETRDERHLTQTEVADRLGVSMRTVQNWESGAYPQPRHRRAILHWVNAVEAA